MPRPRLGLEVGFALFGGIVLEQVGYGVVLARNLLKSPQHPARDLKVDAFGLLTGEAVERRPRDTLPRFDEALIKGVDAYALAGEDVV